jgi:hypothetical protein
MVMTMIVFSISPVQKPDSRCPKCPQYPMPQEYWVFFSHPSFQVTTR